MNREVSRDRKDSNMEGWIARWYARTRHNDIEDFREQAAKVAARLQPGSEVLEVAPGPGFFSIELAKRGQFRVAALDLSRTFVEIARGNAAEAGVDVAFHQGNAADLPFPDGSFDFVYSSAAFKNFADPLGALDEMYRVLRPGGEALIIDLRKDVSPGEIDDYISHSGRKGFDAWFTRQAFRHMLIGRAYTTDQFNALAVASKFADCRIEFDSIGMEVTLRRPRLI